MKWISTANLMKAALENCMLYDVWLGNLSLKVITALTSIYRVAQKNTDSQSGPNLTKVSDIMR